MGLFNKKVKSDAGVKKPEPKAVSVKKAAPPGDTIDIYVGMSVIVQHTRTPGAFHEVFVLEVAPSAPAVHVKFSTTKFPVWDEISTFTVIDVLGDEERDFYNAVRESAVKKRVQKDN